MNLHTRSESTWQIALAAGGWWLAAGGWRPAGGSWPTGWQQLAGPRPAVGRQLAGSWPAAGQPASGRQLAGSWPAAGRQLASRPASRLAGWLPGSWLPASRLAGWLAGQQLAAGWQTHALRLVADGWWLAAGGWLWRKIVFTQDRFHSREITTFFPKCRLALALSSRLVLEVRALLSESPAKAMRLSRVLSKPRHEDGPIQQEGT